MAVTQFGANEVISRGSVNRRITEINETFPLPVSKGGTGATSLVSGNILLGNGTGIISGTSCLPVSKGGTGKTSLTSGQILLGNGTSAITSTATLPVSKGGTGATTAQGIRSNLNVMETKILYNNPSGSNGDITLSPPNDGHLYDYRYLEFYYTNKANGIWDDGMHISKVYRWQVPDTRYPDTLRFNNTIGLTLCGATHSDNNTYFILATTRYNIETQSGDSYKNKAIRLENKSYYISFGATGCSRNALDDNNNIWIFRVVGYKI